MNRHILLILRVEVLLFIVAIYSSKCISLSSVVLDIYLDVEIFLFTFNLYNYFLYAANNM